MREFRVICSSGYVNYGSIELFQRDYSSRTYPDSLINFSVRDSQTDEILFEETLSTSVALKIDPREYYRKIYKFLLEQRGATWKTKFENLESQVEDLLCFTKAVEEGKVLTYPIKATSDDRIKEIARFIERSHKQWGEPGLSPKG